MLYLLLFLIIISYLDFSKSKNTKKSLYLIIFIISTLFYSLSYKTGVDWVEYRRLFDDQLSNNNFELGFLSLANIFNYMNINFWIFIFIIKIVFISSLFYFVWKFCDYPSIAICIIIGLLFPFFNDPVRQLIAATMLFSSVPIIKNSPGYINIFIGSLFHSSYALLLFSKLKKISKKIIIIVTLTLISIIIVTIKNPQLIQILGDNFLTRKLLFYISYASPPNLYSLALRIFFISYICISKNVQDINKRNMPYNTYSLFWVLSFFLLLTEIIAFELPILSQRLRIYLIPFPIIMFLNYIFSQRALLNRIFIITIVYLYIALSLYNFLYGPMGQFYKLENNFFIQLIYEFPNNDIENKVNNFWTNG